MYLPVRVTLLYTSSLACWFSVKYGEGSPDELHGVVIARNPCALHRSYKDGVSTAAQQGVQCDDDIYVVGRGCGCGSGYDGRDPMQRCAKF
jgi:hypothetical protein